jgi:hypothetical protein
MTAGARQQQSMSHTCIFVSQLPLGTRTRAIPRLPEFLTKKTTCASEMSKKTTCGKIYQKGSRLSGGTSGQATRVTCRLGQIRQALAATPNTGMLADGRRHRPPFPVVGPAAIANAGMLPYMM